MSDAVLTCANHPQRETTLRCNRCEKPICSACAVHTPVGYRCKECVRGQQKDFDTILWRDYPVAAVVAAIGVGLGTGLTSFLGLWGLFLAPVIGGGIAEVIRWMVRRRRSRRLPLVAAAGGAVGVLPHLLSPMGLMLAVLSSGSAAEFAGGIVLSAVWPVAQGALILASLYYRLRGIWM